MNNRVIVPYVSISPSRITTFKRLEPSPSRKSISKQDLIDKIYGCEGATEEMLSVVQQEELKATLELINKNRPPIFREHTGIISKKAKKRIRNAIDWLLLMAQEKEVFMPKQKKRFKFKVSFVTLTLASTQIHSDNEIKSKLLNQFFVEARKRWKIDKYVWRAEKQKNGNIHFHILVDKFIDHKHLRIVWNRIQNKLGYVDRYAENQKDFFKNGFKVRTNLLKNWSYSNQKKAYHKGKACGFTNPNSTDIHKVFNVKNISAYVTKYCCKNPEFRLKEDFEIKEKYLELSTDYKELKKMRPIRIYESELVSGKSWGLSQSLSKMKNLILERDSFVDEELRIIEDKYHDQIYVGDHFTTLRIYFKQWKDILFGHLRTLFQEYLQQARDNLEAENLQIIFNL